MRTRAVAILALALLTGRLTAAQVMLDRVVGRVGDRPVTLSDLRVARGLGLVTPVGEGDVAAARAVMDRVLMLMEVSRFQPAEPGPAEVAAEVAALRARAGTPAALAALMATAGLTDARVATLARENLRLRAYLAQRFSGGQTPDATAAWLRDLRQRTDMACLLPGC